MITGFNGEVLKQIIVLILQQKKDKFLNLFRSDCSEIGFICLQTLKSKNQKGKLSISLRRYSILM